MGVLVRNYVMMGVELPYKETMAILKKKYPDADYYNSEFTKKYGNCEIIIDGMNGKYVFFGTVLASSFYEDGAFEKPIILDVLNNKDMGTICRAATEIFGSEFADKYVIGNIKPIVFTHWS